MKRIRKRLTFANVMSSVAVFLVLGGATALAASQLGKNSVGSKQLKKNAVTAAKIKKNAVTRAKIKNTAVNGAKIADGSITGSDINAPSTPFSQATARLRNPATISFGTEAPVLVGTYAQPAGEDDQYLAGLTVTFAASCAAPRAALAYLMINPLDPNKPTTEDISGWGIVIDKTGAAGTQKMNFVPFHEGFRGMQSFAPSATESQSFYVYPVLGECNSGSGVTGSNFGVDVLGTK